MSSARTALSRVLRSRRVMPAARERRAEVTARLMEKLPAFRPEWSAADYEERFGKVMGLLRPFYDQVEQDIVNIEGKLKRLEAEAQSMPSPDAPSRRAR